MLLKKNHFHSRTKKNMRTQHKIPDPPREECLLYHVIIEHSPANMLGSNLYLMGSDMVPRDTERTSAEI